MITGIVTRQDLIHKIIATSLKLASARYSLDYHEQSIQKQELKKLLLQYVLSVVRDSESIEADALRSLLLDDSEGSDPDAQATPSDALAPDPGTVACPNCDEPMVGRVGYDASDNDRILGPIIYQCGKCGYSEQRP